MHACTDTWMHGCMKACSYVRICICMLAFKHVCRQASKGGMEVRRHVGVQL